MSKRDIDGQLNQRFGKVEPRVGKWRPKRPEPRTPDKKVGIGCLLPILILISVILGVL